MSRYRGIVLLMAALLPSWAAAQSAPKLAPKPPADELPAVNTSGGGASPALSPKPSAAGGDGGGTTIIGERESPIGLYITPWRNAAAEVDIDRPARLLSVQLEALDRKVFSRQVEYYEALTAAQKAKTPPAPPSRP